MRLKSDVKDDHSFYALLKSFKFAFEGILTSIRLGRNIKVHCLAAIIVVILSIVLKIQTEHFAILLLTIGQVMTLEMINTAIEKVVDLVSPKQHPLAKIAKDVAAGAVLLSAILAIMIGLVIFIPYLN